MDILPKSRFHFSFCRKPLAKHWKSFVLWGCDPCSRLTNAASSCLLSSKLATWTIFVQKILICFIDGILTSATKGKAEQKPAGVSSMYVGAKWPACNLTMSFQDIEDVDWGLAPFLCCWRQDIINLKAPAALLAELALWLCFSLPEQTNFSRAHGSVKQL